MNPEGKALNIPLLKGRTAAGHRKMLDNLSSLKKTTSSSYARTMGHTRACCVPRDSWSLRPAREPWLSCTAKHTRDPSNLKGDQPCRERKLWTFLVFCQDGSCLMPSVGIFCGNVSRCPRKDRGNATLLSTWAGAGAMPSWAHGVLSLFKRQILKITFAFPLHIPKGG